jgi:hypothetical protein
MKSLTFEEAVEKIRINHCDLFTLVSYSGYHKKCVFIWNQTGERDEWWFFKLCTFKVGDRFPPSLRKQEHQKIKISFSERYAKIKSVKNAILLDFDSDSQKCTVEWPDKEISIHDYTFLIDKRTNTTGSPKTEKERIKKTILERYGVEHISHSNEIALKIAKKVNKPSIKFHWQTNEELVCQGSYEAKVVDYLNLNQIYYKWQPEVFKLSTGKTYRPDLYLVDSDTWVEIKGWMRLDAKEKWDEFHTNYPNSEIWSKEKLKDMKIL